MTHSLTQRAITEGIGTFMLVLVGAGAVMADAQGAGLGAPGIALAFTFVVAAMVYSTGHISGAHINPAVTCAFWSVGRFAGRDVPAYVAAQLLGAIGAALLLKWIHGPVASIGATVPAVNLPQAFTVEVVITFGLMFVITAVATDRRVPPAAVGAAIGIAVGMGALAGGSATGASMNPARSFGPAVASGVWTSHWVYWVAPTAGAVLAARVYGRVSSDGKGVPERDS